MTSWKKRQQDRVLVTELDLNLLQPELRRQKPTVLTLRPWILLLLYTLLLVPCLLLLQLGETTLTHLEINLESAQKELASFSAISDERKELKGRLEEAKLQADQVEGAYRRIGFTPLTYSVVLHTITGSVPHGSELTGLNQDGPNIYLAGNADNHLLPVTFVETLQSTGLFSTANLEMLKRVEALEVSESSEAEAISVYRYEFEVTLEMIANPDEP